MENNPLMAARVVVAYDATKDRTEQEFKSIFDNIRLRGDLLRGGDTLMVLGVLHKVLHPCPSLFPLEGIELSCQATESFYQDLLGSGCSGYKQRSAEEWKGFPKFTCKVGYQMQASPQSSAGAHNRALEEEVSKKVDTYVTMLMHSAEGFEEQGVDIEVKITAGTPPKQVVVQEITNCNATWVILDRHFRRDFRFYLKQIPCKIAFIQDNLSVEVLRSHNSTDTDNIEHKLVFSKSKPVPLLAVQDNENNEQSVISCGSFSASMSSMESSDVLKSNLPSSFMQRPREYSFLSHVDIASISKQDKSGRQTKGENKYISSPILQKPRESTSRHRSSDAPVLCASCGIKTDMSMKDTMRFSFSEIQLATGDFSKENLLGEGGYGHVYKGQLKDGQLIAAKVRKEASSQGFTEFHSEVNVLSFARHKNIVMLLGYCCKENLNILVYEYICNKSLDWHLFDEAGNVLEWHQRHAIAIGTAKGLRFLHEECRGSPIIHRDMRPSNILLTHEFVPMDYVNQLRKRIGHHA
ncbi:unnamed protein product [Ilex paraguariensis]|uniref:Protein kinase domain-containing protein n=1 Tax=Ilex paraguariensis TaxID=185542 RepID=A0ABC8V375_9AQUA